MADRVASRRISGGATIDIMVNSVGISHHRPALKLRVEDWDRVLDINHRGTFLCCQAVGRSMTAKGKGAIINFSLATGIVLAVDGGFLKR